MASYEDRLHQRNLDLARVELRYVNKLIDDAIVNWVDQKTQEAKDADLPPYRLLEPLSPEEIVGLVVENLNFVGGAPIQGELESTLHDDSEGDE